MRTLIESVFATVRHRTVRTKGKRRLDHTFRTDICSVSLRFDLNRKA